MPNFEHTFTNIAEENEYPKLIRDRIPEIVERAEGRILSVETLGDEAFEFYLRKKIKEEAAELADADDDSHLLEEIADVREVIDALLSIKGLKDADADEIQAKKREARGGFAKRLVMLPDEALANEKIISQGSLFELVQLPQPDGRIFEIARRAPGVRVIISNEAERTILLTKEYRRELGGYDYRLPGGKVFDTLDEFAAFRTSGNDILDAAVAQAEREVQQEAGVEVSGLSLYKKSVLGATVEWDLYVFETKEWQLSVQGQELEVGEKIEADTWVSYEEARQMILAGNMQEERIALIVLQWLEAQR